MAVRVYAESAHSELLAGATLPASYLDGNNHRRGHMGMSTSERNIRPRSQPADPTAERLKADRLQREKRRHAMYWEQAQASVAAEQAALKQKVAYEKEKREQRFHHMMRTLDREAQVVAGIETGLTVKDDSDARRRDQLYKEWSRTVFNPIQQQIGQQLDAVPTSDIELRRRAAFEEYLETSNRSFGRTTVALPPAIPTRSLRATAPSPITYGVSRRSDPLHRPRAQVVHEKKQLQDLSKAATITRRGLVGVPLEVPPVDDTPQSRAVLDLHMWDKLEATPHGRYEQTFTSDRSVALANPIDAHNHTQGGVPPAGLAQKVLKPKQRAPQTSQMILDDYHIDTDPATAQRQFFPNVKRVFPEARRVENIITNE